MHNEFYINVAEGFNQLLVRKIRDGKEVMERINYEPTLYLPTRTQSPWRTIHGEYLKPNTFSEMKEAKAFLKEHKESNLKVYGFPNFAAQYNLDTYPHAEKDWQRQYIRGGFIDIEVESDDGFPEPMEAKKRINAITYYDSMHDKFFVWGLGKWRREDSQLPEDVLVRVKYTEWTSEVEMLSAFVRFWQMYYPAFVTGWNSNGFDMLYIYNRLENIGVPARQLSPWGHVRLREYRDKRGLQHEVIIRGIALLDYMDLYKKRKVRENYRLDSVAYWELKDNKLDISEEGTLYELYKTNWQKFIDYNIQDCNIVVRLDEALGLLDSQIGVAYTAGVNYDDVSGSVKTWDALINKQLQADGMQPVSQISVSQTADANKIDGGYVKEVMKGKHGWTLSFDAASLYPHIIQQYNISPEKLVGADQIMPEKGNEERVSAFLNGATPPITREGVGVAGSGWQFDMQQEGFMPKIMRTLYQERDALKRQMKEAKKAGDKEKAKWFDIAQNVRKILLNSGYGVFTNQYFRYYDRRLAESITLSGQLAIKVSERAMNEFINKAAGTKDVDYVIAIDTDSNYVNVQPIVDKYFANMPTEKIVDALDKIANEQIAKALNQALTELSTRMRARGNFVHMKRECIAEAALWTAKKRYAMWVHDVEGVRYSEPDLKVQGLESVKSSTPEPVRKYLETLLPKILIGNEQEVQEDIINFKEEFYKLDPADIAFPRSINNIEKYDAGGGEGRKGCPGHVRGAIKYNWAIQSNESTAKMDQIKSGDKAKYIYLREPNKLKTDILTFITRIPAELSVAEHIDYHTMFEKSTIEPIRGILDPIGWSTEKQTTLDDFFN